MDDQVKAIAKRSGEAPAIFGDLCRSTAARATFGAEKSAGTWVHRGNQDEARGEDSRTGRAGDGHPSFLERLAQHFKDAAIEFRHLVEKQDAVMRERDL